MSKSTRRTQRHQSQTALIQRNLQFIAAALCDQALQLRNDPDASGRLLTIAGDLERVTDKIVGAS